MKRFAPAIAGLAILTGCATTTVPIASAPGPSTDFGATLAGTPPGVYRGLVWTWDEREGWVTLRQGAQDIRVKISQDQFKTLRHLEMATVRGELAPPSDLVTVVQPPPNVVYVPSGPETSVTTMTGRVTAYDPQGRITVQADQGASDLWIAQQSKYQVGDTVIVTTTLRPVQFAPAGSATSSDPAAAVANEPGDFAIVNGRVIARNTDGRLTVDSPRGPMQVWVSRSDVEKFRVGDYVQVRSRVRSQTP